MERLQQRRSYSNMGCGAAEMDEKDKSRRTLAGDLGVLLSSGTDYDVTIMADGIWLPAHRAVMAARSPVFAAMYRHDLLEASKGCVNITDINQEVLRQLLHFMYTDEVPLLDCVAAELLVAAEKYNVPRLKQRCEQQLVQDLCVENAADSAVLAMTYSCKKLKAEAIAFIHAHYVEVMATDGWANALRQNTEDAVEICRRLGQSARLKLECGNEASKATEGAKGSLASDLLALLESTEGSDVRFKVGRVGRIRLAAHKTVLAARSPVLAKKLKETTGGVLQVDGVRPEELRHALRYIYGDQLPPPASVTERLLVLANEYALHGLKEYCEKQLAQTITLENAVSLAVFATKNYYFSIERACAEFIKKNIFDVMCTEGWGAAIRNDAEAMVKISKSVGLARTSVKDSVNLFTFGTDAFKKE